MKKFLLSLLFFPLLALASDPYSPVREGNTGVSTYTQLETVVDHDDTQGGTVDDAHFDHADDLAELNTQVGAALVDTGTLTDTKYCVWDAVGTEVDCNAEGGAPTSADYLVGTANATLSAEIVVGTSPQGELGGTWAAPTVDATHAGSTHELASDLTPQLSGDLDVNGQSIVSVSNADIPISPDGTGIVDVTGTLSADVLSVNTTSATSDINVGGDIEVDATDSRGLRLKRSGTLYGLISTASSKFTLQADHNNGMQILTQGTGNVLSFGSNTETTLGSSAGAYLNSNVSDGAAAFAYRLDTGNTLATAGAIHTVFRNNGTDIASIDKDGGISIAEERYTLSHVDGGSADYLVAKANTTGKHYQLRLVPKDMDGTDNTIISIDTLGTYGSTDRESINIGYQASTNSYKIGVYAAGTGTLRPFKIDMPWNTATPAFTVATDANVGILNASPDTALDVNGAITQRELSADPTDPDEGSWAWWLSDGTGTGEDGEVWASVTAAATTTDYKLVGPGAYGVLSVQAGSTGETTVDTTPRKIAAWNTNGISNETTVDHTDDSIKGTRAGIYDVNASISFSGTNSSTVTIEIYVYDDSATTWGASGFALERKLGAGGDVGSASVNGLVSLDADDKVALYQSSDGSAMTVTEAQLTLVRVSD